MTKVKNYERDGTMSVKGNYGDGINYEPNSYGGPKEVPRAAISSYEINAKIGRYEFTHPNTNFEQPLAFWLSLSADD